jgi:CelD/BcsL family acetyltransferase involved in cellulose biosynthesis
MKGCPYVPLPSTWEAYTRGLSKETRYNIGRAERAVQAAFPDLRLSLASRETLKEGMNAFFALHSARWRSRSRPGLFSSPRVQSFHLDVARRFLENGWLRLCLLHARGAPRAAYYWFALQGRWFEYGSGFDPALAKYSLGTVLLAWGIRQAIQEGCTEADLLRGEEAYKNHWRPKSRMSYRILLVRPRGGPGGIGELPGTVWSLFERVVRRLGQP